MVDPIDELSDRADLPRQPCFKCGEFFPADELKRTVVPPLFFMASLTDCEPDDPNPPRFFTDHNLYCPWCRWSANFRRGFLVIFVVMWILYLAK